MYHLWVEQGIHKVIYQNDHRSMFGNSGIVTLKQTIRLIGGLFEKAVVQISLTLRSTWVSQSTTKIANVPNPLAYQAGYAPTAPITISPLILSSTEVESD
jgi:hypothetical protein